jgi:hypothetical protein
LQFCDSSTRAQSKKINFFSNIDIKKTSFLRFFFMDIFEKIIKFSIKINHKIWVELIFIDNWRDLKIYDFFFYFKTLQLSLKLDSTQILWLFFIGNLMFFSKRFTSKISKKRFILYRFLKKSWSFYFELSYQYVWWYTRVRSKKINFLTISYKSKWINF